MSRLGYCTTPTGATLELFRDGARFWTERSDACGTSIVLVDTLRAAETYELFESEGHIDAPFPFGLPVVRR